MVSAARPSAIPDYPSGSGVQTGRRTFTKARQALQATEGALQEQPAAIQAEEKETGRLEAFSDDVFAVAITLLALDLPVPKLGNDAPAAAVAAALARQWPSYLAFITGFFTFSLCG
jgi:uncharacterized protein YkwD